MTVKMEDNFLEHYGVKGMQWGVRKSGKGSSTPSNDPRSTRTKGFDKSRKLSDIPTDELQTMVNRMNLEKNYISLYEGGSAKKANSGAKFATDILTNVARQQITNGLSRQVGKLMAEAAKKSAG